MIRFGGSLTGLIAVLVISSPVRGERRTRDERRDEALAVIDTRSNAGTAERFCRDYGPNCLPIGAHVREFSNGNTFVQIDRNLANENVVVLMPGEMTADTFMEVLLKVHTAHSVGARRIEVRVERRPAVIDADSGGRALLWPADVRDMLAKAGAGRLFEGPRAIDLNAMRFVRPPGRDHQPEMKTKVMSINYPELGLDVARALGVPHLPRERLARGDWPRGHQIVLIAAAIAPTNRTLFQALRMVRRLNALGNRVLTVVPYLPYVRSDKIDQPGVSVGGKLIADLFQTAGTDLISFVKLHAPQAQGFFDIPSIHIETRSEIARLLRELGVEAVVSPDAGFQKEATLYANEVNLPVFVLNKQRDPRTGVSQLQTMGDFDVEGKTLALIDDETASGSTLTSSAEFLRARGAKTVYAFVSHLAGGAEKVFGNPAITALYVTDTFPVPNPSDQLRVIPVAHAIASSLEVYVRGCARILESPK